MSKGLIALGKITGTQNLTMYEQDVCLKTIEEELKRLEELDNGAYVSIHINRYNELCDKEKALEIIKNKEINVHALFLHLKRFDKPDGYNVLVGTKYQITQEEYDLLKEVLL